jgi:hypothetical protein
MVLYVRRFFGKNIAGGFDDAIDIITNTLEVARIFGQEIMHGPCPK